MNKTAIKNFAVWARRKLIADITYKAGLLGLSESGIAKPLPQSTKDLQFFDIGTREYVQVSGREIDQRNALVKAIKERQADGEYADAFKAIIEEIAYTWFNRLVAIRFMEVNDYLPSRVRVLSSENPAKDEPDFVTNPFDTDLDFTAAERDLIMELKEESRLDELFRMLFIRQCNKLHEILPELFEETDDYTELLLNISFTDKDGVVYHLVHDIAEDDFDIEKEGQVEIIGWLYQYYNIEPKDETFALLKKNVKITKERIPAATQLFTPDWIVRYMVENSLGRLWSEGHPGSSIKENWKYYLEEAEQEPEVQDQLAEIRKEYEGLRPEDIKVMDPCMGSGHILVYAFDVLMQIYESAGYTQRDAAQAILAYNLFGLDIDRRAAQLAYFAVMMKARQYDRRIFSRGIKPHVYAIEESNGVNRSQLKFFGCNLSDLERNMAMSETNALLDTLEDAKEYGSILNVDNYNWELLGRFARDADIEDQMSMETIGIEQTQEKLLQLLQLGQVMAQKYDVVVTNPPYMGASGMGAKLSKYVKENYPDSKSDMSTVCMEKAISMCNTNGYMSMINIPVWMFLSSFEKLRKTILKNNTITSMAHPGRGIFGSDFGTTSFVIAKQQVKEYKGTYCRLFDVQGEVKSIEEREKAFLAEKGRYTAQQDNFSKIPGSPVAYWVSENAIKAFDAPPFSERFISGGRNKTHNNERYVRCWWEISDFLKWMPYSNGGEYRKWYGNNVDMINWSSEAQLFYSDHGGLLKEEYWEIPAITWNDITSGASSYRIKPIKSKYSSVSPTLISPNKDYDYTMLAFLNSRVCEWMNNITNPTLHTLVGNVLVLPDKIKKFDESKLAKECITISRFDWDSFETSWDFRHHPLLPDATSQEPDMNENTLEFAVFCVEMLAKELNTTGDKVCDLLTAESDLLDSYILPCYETLHTQSREYIVNDLLEVMRQKGVIA